MDKSSASENIETSRTSAQSVTASKKTYEGLWRFIFLIISLVSAFLLNRIYVYQTNPAFDDVRKGTLINLVIFGIPFAIFYTIVDTLVHYFFDDLCDKYYINHATYTNVQARKKRCYTLVKWGFSIFYYGFSSIACFFIMKNTSYFPKWLGGNGTPMNIYNDYPENSQFTRPIEIFYLVQFGKHLSRMVSHFFIRPEGNFYEYGLHHSLSIFLITFSYTMDQWLIGSFVLLIHDFTDFTLIFARAYKDYRNYSKVILKVFYVIGFATWIICRIFIFSYSFIYAMNRGIYNVMLPKMQEALDPIYKDTMYLPILFMAGMLIILQGLQLFWTYYILRSYISVNISAKIATHNYD